MGWAYCGENRHGQIIGYGVEADCDEPGCTTTIDRGLGFLCGEMHDDANTCAKYYCGPHQTLINRCRRCAVPEPVSLPSGPTPPLLQDAGIATFEELFENRGTLSPEQAQRFVDRIIESSKLMLPKPTFHCMRCGLKLTPLPREDDDFADPGHYPHICMPTTPKRSLDETLRFNTPVNERPPPNEDSV